MRRICCFLILGILLSASLVFAADFWEKKDYSTWNDKEVTKMLEDSPWARKVRIREVEAMSFGGFGGGMGGGMPGGGMGGEMPGGGMGGEMPGGGMGGGMPDGGMGGGMPGAPPAASDSDDNAGSGGGDDQNAAAKSTGGDVPGAKAAPKKAPGGMGGGFGRGFGGGFGGPNFRTDLLGGLPMVVMRWQSALPVKQAMARFRFKDEVKTSKEAADSVNREETVHILGIVGLPGNVQSFNAEDIKAKSSIIIEDRPEIKPTQVIPQQEGTTVGLYVVFPKFDENNSPVITLEDKNIEVSIGMGRYAVVKKFGLKDMRYQDKLDF